jgi:hypothetical protein
MTTIDVQVYQDDDGHWLAVEADNRVHVFSTEAEACNFQLLWRAWHGLDAVTGEPVDGDGGVTSTL